MALKNEKMNPCFAIIDKNTLESIALKDILWEELNKEQNQVIDISHAPIDVKVIERVEEDDEEDDEPHTIYLNEVEEEWDLEKYRGIGWDTQE